MGGPMSEPSGRRPSRIEAATSASVQRPMPVSGSGVMLGATARKPRSTNTRPPASSMPGRRAPSGARVVWQAPQKKAAVSTR